MELNEDVMVSTLNLAVQQWHASNRIPRGLMHVKAHANIALELDQLVAQLTAITLKEERAETFSRTIQVVVPKFPRWIPKWLQRRWSKLEPHTITCTVAYHYPEANIKVPDLGNGYPFVQIAYRDWDDE